MKPPGDRPEFVCRGRLEQCLQHLIVLTVGRLAVWNSEQCRGQPAIPFSREEPAARHRMRSAAATDPTKSALREMTGVVLGQESSLRDRGADLMFYLSIDSTKGFTQLVVEPEQWRGGGAPVRQQQAAGAVTDHGGLKRVDLVDHHDVATVQKKFLDANIRIDMAVRLDRDV